MSELLSKAKEQWLYWRLLIVKFAFHSVVSLGSAWIVATANINIGSLGNWERFGLLVGVMVNWGNTMNALLDQTLSRLAKGQLPMGGDTQFLTKTGSTSALPTPPAPPA